MILIDNISKYFGNTVALENVSCEIRTSEITAVIGPSGGGKTTLLRCINGLELPDSGEISVDGIVLTKKTAGIIRKEVGMVFQQFNLFPHLSVLRNVTIAQQVVKRKKTIEAEETASSLLQKVGLEDKITCYHCQLSGGQQQRVAIARALALNPKIMLFDEPTSNLDPEMTKEVLNVIRNLAKEGMTMIIASHEMGFAQEVANKILFMDNGTIVEEGTPQEIFNSPKHDRTIRFLSKIIRC
ncbi:MAG: glutamine ABC transporter ATP-binding protein [Elusimicrobia bacterium CG1_02_37_114]|nr:MAG: glutamine ABC transporter ATP-binding protein [Elusimicrobia bacterium CG1_02_37_114]PIV53479.1 MAG: glutamine ABC transporter ATP-binding protein [Elusimicrobia bacterium CG02_land_8_20_14_3_00_37_13]PIZ13221.1 MAG: glutamine ABC transporter ATP-binding protein [Elusimicrobia bacterium CG_4_10_14_0_8_um_filter_37_32]